MVTAMRNILVSLVFSILSQAQTLPFFLNNTINLISPATGPQGSTVLFGAAVASDGTVLQGTNLYLFSEANASIRQLTNYAGTSNLTGVTSVAYADSAGFAAFVSLPAGPTSVAEEVHLIDISSAQDRMLVSDNEGCVEPLCIPCFHPCVGPVHVSADAGKVLYKVARQQPLFVVNADGTGLTHLPIYSGSLAPSPLRVISSAGMVVFTSSAPSAPATAAGADVYTMNLDGSGLTQVTKFGSAMFSAGNATISADGSLIAFESNFSAAGASQNNQIWLVHPDGSSLRQLSTGPDTASNPSISADGSVVTFLQSGQIKRAGTGSNETILTLTNLSVSAPGNPALSPDGAWLSFTLGPRSGSAAAVYRIPTNSPSHSLSSLAIYAPHLFNTNGVVSADGYGVPSPGSLISAYGANFGSEELTQANGFPLPVSLDSVSLLVNGESIPLLAVTPWQINAQLPQTVPAAPATFQVRVGNVALPAASVQVSSVSPENFVIPFTSRSLSYPQAAAFHAGTSILADMDHPAAAGETLEIYGLGFGVTDPLVAAGVPSPASPLARAHQMPQLQIGGVDAAIKFAGLTPGVVGVYQVNAVVPQGLAAGLQNLTWGGPGGPVDNSSIAVK